MPKQFRFQPEGSNWLGTPENGQNKQQCAWPSQVTPFQPHAFEETISTIQKKRIRG
jgi:hypothetical protein